MQFLTYAKLYVKFVQLDIQYKILEQKYKKLLNVIDKDFYGEDEGLFI